MVRTDHAGLTYLKIFENQNARLMRWSVKLCEIDFTVEHRPGNKTPRVNALSRHVGAVLQTGGLCLETVLREQASDKFCQSLKAGTYQSKHEFFLDDEGLIYRRRSNDKHQLIISNTLVADVIRENHDPVYIAHPGIKRTFELLALSFWWPRMRKAVEEYIKKCDACQRRKEDPEFITPLGEVDMPDSPFQVTSVDITGPYPVTPRRNRYLLTFIDHYTRNAEAFPIPDQKAETCAQVYATQIVMRHGSGSKLISDKGLASMFAFFNETCKILRIRRARTSSYHPESNGTVERLHRSLHTALSHYVKAMQTTGTF